MKKLTLKYYFHIHHDILMEILTEPLENRIKYIKDYKPEDEIELRLKLIKPVKGKLPSELIEADQARAKAYQAQVKAYQARAKEDQVWAEADQAWVKAYSVWVLADQARVKAYQDNMPALEKLHKVECGCGYSFMKTQPTYTSRPFSIKKKI